MNARFAVDTLKSLNGLSRDFKSHEYALPGQLREAMGKKLKDLDGARDILGEIQVKHGETVKAVVSKDAWRTLKGFDGFLSNLGC